jgi:hypothetical protein
MQRPWANLARNRRSKGAEAIDEVRERPPQVSQQLPPTPISTPVRGASAQRPVADPVARAGAEAGGTVVRIGELTAIERETAATDALGEPEL